MELIQRVLRNPGFRGVMAYRGYEALKLADAGITDILMGYPLSDPKEISAVIERNSETQKIVLMVDQPAHLDLIESLAKNSGKKIPICIDLDVSTQYFGTHFGVNRSWIKSDERVAEFLKHLKTCPSLRLMSAMGYEAQIAGVPDVGFKFQLYKTLSSPELNSRRTRWVKQIEESVGKLEYVNGGGTGSFESTLQDPSVTELTSGSGLYSPGLFDHYKAFKHQPAAGYVLQIVRKPEENIITCFGGGYIASGGIGPLKVPVIMDPPGLTFF
jgi:D-serine deaminase-like pyridoxal phosphate-dependent protein